MEWVHTNRFGHVKRQGWLDALVFYGLRHPLSRRAWAYWEYCEKAWNEKRPPSLQSFERWWRSAQQWPFCEWANWSAVAAAVETYLDWGALTLWLRPLFFGSVGLPPYVLSELERRCPGIATLNHSSTPRGGNARSSMWRRTMEVGRDHFLRRREGSVGSATFLNKCVHIRGM